MIPLSAIEYTGTSWTTVGNVAPLPPAEPGELAEGEMQEPGVVEEPAEDG